MLTIEAATKKQIKDSKLRQLSSQHYEMQLQQIYHQARGEDEMATRMSVELTKIEAGYRAIEAAE